MTCLDGWTSAFINPNEIQRGFPSIIEEEEEDKGWVGPLFFLTEVGFGLVIFGQSGLFLTQAVGFHLLWVAHFC